MREYYPQGLSRTWQEGAEYAAAFISYTQKRNLEAFLLLKRLCDSAQTPQQHSELRSWRASCATIGHSDSFPAVVWSPHVEKNSLDRYVLKNACITLHVVRSMSCKKRSTGDILWKLGDSLAQNRRKCAESSQLDSQKAASHNIEW